VRQRAQLRDETGDPWDGRSLEWSTASPPPAFNFAVLPQVSGEDAYWKSKYRATEQSGSDQEPVYRDIEIPRNSATGFVCALFATMMGFALIWHIWWMAAAALVGAFAVFVWFAWRDTDEYAIDADAVARIDRAWRRARADAQDGRPA
jgi:cytochrome o ubiquinol oxidase subunit 1